MRALALAGAGCKPSRPALLRAPGAGLAAAFFALRLAAERPAAPALRSSAGPVSPAPHLSAGPAAAVGRGSVVQASGVPS